MNTVRKVESKMMKNLTNDAILNLAKLSIVRLDGAWFIAIAKKYGIEAAWKIAGMEDSIEETSP